jgi:hypothetical protein
MVAVGLLTYLIVFNLNLLVSFSKSSYSSLKIGILSSMQADSRNSWKKKGELFHKYRPRENAEQSKPSEWWILVYLLQRGWDILIFRKKKKDKEEDEDEDEDEEGGEKERKWYARLLRKDGKKESVSTAPDDGADDIF